MRALTMEHPKTTTFWLPFLMVLYTTNTVSSLECNFWPTGAPTITDVERLGVDTLRLTIELKGAAWRWPGCETSAFDIRVTYTKTATSVVSTKSFNGDSDELDVDGLESCEEYELTAFVYDPANSTVHSDESNHMTEFTDAPAPITSPAILRVARVNGRTDQLIVEWTYDDAVTDRGCSQAMDYDFIIYFRRDDNTLVEEHRVSDQGNRQKTVTAGFTECTKYKVTVTVENHVGGESPASKMKSQFTSSSDPNEPFAVTVTRVIGQNQRLDVSWQYNADRDNLKCDPSDGYEFVINYRSPESGHSGDEVIDGGNANTVTLTGLKTCTNYNVKVKVKNFVNMESDFSPTDSERTDARAPMTPPNLISVNSVDESTSQLRVSWSFTGANDLGCDPSRGFSFLIHYRHGGNSNNKEVTDVDSTSYTLSELDGCTEYAISMTVKNAVGRESTGSSTEEQYTNSEVPVAATSITVERVLDQHHQLKVSWAYTADRGSLKCDPSQGYKFLVYYQSTEASDSGSKEIAGLENGPATTISGLEECTNYDITVAVENHLGEESPQSSPVSQRTDGPVPSVSPGLDVISRVPIGNLTTAELSVNWTFSDSDINCPGGFSFRVHYKELLDNTSAISEEHTDQAAREMTIGGLRSCTGYHVGVSVVNSVDKISNISWGQEITDAEAPSEPPNNLILTPGGSSAMRVSWQIPEPDVTWLKCEPENHNISYVVRYAKAHPMVSSAGGDGSIIVSGQETVITELEPCTQYLTSVTVRNIVQHESVPTKSTEMTESVDPGRITSAEVSALSNSELHVDWDPPPSECEVTGFRVRRSLIFYDQCQDGVEHFDEYMVDASITEHTFSGLETYSTYGIGIAAISRGVYGDEFEDIGVTGEGVPGRVENLRLEGGKTEIRADWQVPVCGQRRGVIDYSYRYLKAEGSPGDWRNTSETSVTIGGLNSGSEYRVEVRAITTAGSGESDGEEVTLEGATPGALIGGVVVGSFGFLLIILLLVFIFVVKPRRRKIQAQDLAKQEISYANVYANTAYDNTKQEVTIAPDNGEGVAATTPNNTTPVASVETTPREPNPSANSNTPVNLAEFKAYYKKQMSDNFNTVHAEFEKLHGDDYASTAIADREENKMKNRYRNVVTYDHSRVKIDATEGKADSDYINASYIDGYKTENFYIATQGPNSHSVDDFWKMVWNEGSNTIVMLCNLVEDNKTKCEQYWPTTTKNVQLSGDASITLTKSHDMGSMRVREMSIAKKEVVRDITQYHYTAWPDMGVPKTSLDLWKLLEMANKKNETSSGPMIVHCSAGCGRTGTIIALDILKKQAEAEKTVNIFNVVNEMRTRRTSMVQVVDQYTFICASVLEKFFIGSTVVGCEDFHSELELWRSNGDLTKLFELLDTVSVGAPPKESAGNLQENIAKNRKAALIPHDRSRPMLMTPNSGDPLSNDYINASFFANSEGLDAFIATQEPLPNTIADFWRLVWDYRCSSIVVLHDFDLNDETTPRYWPDSGKETFGPFIAELVQEDTSIDGIVQRTMYISMEAPPSEASENSREVKQLVIADWPRKTNTPKCGSPSSLLKAAKIAEDLRKQTEGSNTLVHCKNGIGRSGTFIALANLWSDVRDRQEVDVFNAVKALRLRRPLMVDSQARFNFCFEAIDQYLEDFNTYANV